MIDFAIEVIADMIVYSITKFIINKLENKTS